MKTPAQIAREKLLPKITQIEQRMSQVKGLAAYIHEINNLRCGVLHLIKYAEEIEESCLTCPCRIGEKMNPKNDE